jgi:hypothetical protein
VIEVRHWVDRPVSRGPGIETRHSFSAGAHYEPENTHFGPLVAHDVHVLAAGAGFDRHPHRGLEIVSWVLCGTLRHEDATRRATVRPGMVQHLSAGSGIEHAERNDRDDELRFVQMWLLGGTGPPAYRTATPPLELIDARFDVVAFDGETRLPAAPFVHVFVVDGEVEIGDAALGAGDEARISGEAAALRGRAAAHLDDVTRSFEMTGNRLARAITFAATIRPTVSATLCS